MDDSQTSAAIWQYVGVASFPVDDEVVTESEVSEISVLLITSISGDFFFAPSRDSGTRGRSTCVPPSSFRALLCSLLFDSLLLAAPEDSAPRCTRPCVAMAMRRSRAIS